MSAFTAKSAKVTKNNFLAVSMRSLWWRVLLPAFVAARVSPENPPVNILVVITGARAIIRRA